VRVPFEICLSLCLGPVAQTVAHGASEAQRATPSPTAQADRLGQLRENARDGLKYVLVPAGSFEMGCAPADPGCSASEKPRHHVTLTRGFWLGRTLATAAAYMRFASQTGRRLPQGTEYRDERWKARPAQSLSWRDAGAFCSWSGGRLPTEAEWEYAARGGREGLIHPWGNGGPWDQAGDAPLTSPNGFGLYQMAGTAGQWCSDRYDEGYYSVSPSTDPVGASDGDQRSLRGGSSGARHNAWLLRTSRRDRGSPGIAYADAGVRCARDSAP
jgi:formylglycine-generating enzyme required for sulfatase activity